MDSNFQTLPTNVSLVPNQPLQIIKAEITSDLNLAIDFLSISSKPISRVCFTVVYKDEFNNYLFNATEVYYDIKNLEIMPKKNYFLDPFPIDERFKDARGIDIRIKEISFSDSDIMIFNQKEERQYTLPLISENKKEKMKSALGPEIIGYGENLMDGWRCVCGAFNSKENEECAFCNRNKNFVLNNLTEPLINMKLLNVLSETDTGESENLENLASHLTQTHLTKVAPTTTSLNETRINDESEDVETKSIFNVLIKIVSRLIIILLLAIVVIFVFKFTENIRADRNMNSAKTLITQGQYEDALKVLKKIKDVDLEDEVNAEIEKTKKLLESQNFFEEGNRLILKDDYFEAVKSFKKVSPEDALNYSKSQDKITELENIILEDAKKTFEDGNTPGAVSIIDNYLKIVPESANALNLKDLILQNNAKEIEDPDSGSLINEEDVELDKTRAEMSKKADALLNTYQKVVAEKANLRVNPSTDAEIVTILPTDSDLYIQETKIEGIDRIWCRVEAVDAETGISYSGWISNTTMVQ